MGSVVLIFFCIIHDANFESVSEYLPLLFWNIIILLNLSYPKCQIPIVKFEIYGQELDFCHLHFFLFIFIISFFLFLSLALCLCLSLSRYFLFFSLLYFSVFLFISESLFSYVAVAFCLFSFCLSQFFLSLHVSFLVPCLILSCFSVHRYRKSMRYTKREDGNDCSPESCKDS